MSTADKEAGWQLQIVSAAGKAPQFIAGEGKPTASLTKVSPGLQIVLRGDAGQLAETSASFRERLIERFEDDDTNDDEALSDDELATDQANRFWSAFLPLLDRDADAKLSLAELHRWLDLQEQIASCHLLISVLDAEQGLFELLDESRDGALSAHELRSAKEKLTTCGAFDGKTLDFAKLPRVMLITVSQGYPRSPLGSAEQTGPAWFLAMDRNQDGEVSRAEFVGPADVFRKLDADSSGTLSAAEAAEKK
jgi:Ca2+-binding EF-hand superfamily protein